MTLTQAQSPQRHPSAHIPKHTHTHAANLTDSSAALIADLNRPGDLSLSLTHTRHTSFFFPSSFFLPFLLFSLSPFFFSPRPNIPRSLSPCHFTSAHSPPLSLSPPPPPIIFTRNFLASVVPHSIGVRTQYASCFRPFPRDLCAVFKHVYVTLCI